jgi:hypothetical protein
MARAEAASAITVAIGPPTTNSTFSLNNITVPPVSFPKVSMGRKYRKVIDKMMDLAINLSVDRSDTRWHKLRLIR